MKMMRAQVLTEPCKFELKEVPVPQINDDEALVKITYCGICGSDWGSYTGKYADEVECIPLTTGHEFCGVVEEVGKDAKDIKVGDRVAADICIPCGTCYHCRIGEPLLCADFTQIGIHIDGGFAEYVKVPWKNLYKVPDEVSDEKAAFIEPLTATLNASKKMECQIARSVVVIGCGLGIIHAKLAKLRGAAPVIIVGDNAERLAMAKEMGAADITIDITTGIDVVEEVMKITNGVGADYALEAVGNSKPYEQAFKMIRRGGKGEAFGICADDDYASLPPVEFVLQEKKVSGSTAGIGYDWGDAITLLKYDMVDPTPMISMIVPLEELEDALKEIRTNQKLIKVLVAPGLKERKILYK
ncbi:MAG: alcohol dehydrogenase catalytic domain-containing protein [Christensenella sp.]|uniref:zinc-dependent alcohol dehydrogenase n=1 Tax=Christensenella sp. TaxID=1935934 RepID=UPI002B204B9B|nr:alcohol dehydrogenase catalytic domain-containing protein [Christensenella sp.]MEA5002587.1 alcohol dehydrogenase catalytic domain-containing protein [Christensenella sp.]